MVPAYSEAWGTEAICSRGNNTAHSGHLSMVVSASGTIQMLQDTDDCAWNPDISVRGAGVSPSAPLCG